MNRIVAGLVVAMVFCGIAPAAAQRAGAQARPGRAALLRSIDQMFFNRVVRQMGLSADQLPRFRSVVTDWAQKRQAVESDGAALRQALAGQLRPGIAADADSVARLVDALNANQVAYAQTFPDEMHDLTPILTPVQRGQFVLLRDQLLQAVQQIQLKRSAGRGQLGGTAPPP